MFLHSKVLILLAFSLSSLFCVTYGQMIEFPYIACENYFKYSCDGDTYYGKMKLPNSVYDGTTEIEVEFSQRYPVESDYYGEISLYYDEEKTKRNLKRGHRVKFCIDFPLKNVLPKLTKITIGGRVICSAAAYSYPSISFTLSHAAVITQETDKPLPAPEQDFHQSEVCGLEGTGISSGMSATNIRVPLIYGGRPLRDGQYPWMTAIYRKRHRSNSFFCGGTLISASYILSAAHCVHDSRPETILVELGRYDLNNQMGNVVSRDIQRIVVHPDYVHRVRGVDSDADLALLRMENPLGSFTETIRPICLWTESVDESLIVGQSATIAGWGDEEVHNNISPIPKKVVTEMASKMACSEPSTERTLCAGKLNGEGPCHGDSGGALMMLRNDRWVLRGVVSAGHDSHGRCDNNQYSIYCDVARHMTWVRRYL